MFSEALASLEILLVLLGVGLLYWWTNKEANEANKNLQDKMPATEEDYLVMMMNAAKSNEKLNPVVLARQTVLSGYLQRNTTCEVQQLAVYHAARVGIARQARFRSERRAFFSDKNWKRYRAVIADAEKEKEQRMVRFTSRML